MTQFGDSESGQRDFKEDEFSFRLIFLSALKQIVTRLACVEFRGGYWTTRTTQGPSGVATQEKTYVADSREVFCNAVMALYEFVLPWIEEDQKKEDFDPIIDSINQARERYLGQDELMTVDLYSPDDKTKIDKYKTLNLRIHRRLFTELNRYAKSTGYFEMGSFEDSAGDLTPDE